MRQHLRQTTLGLQTRNDANQSLGGDPSNIFDVDGLAVWTGWICSDHSGMENGSTPGGLWFRTCRFRRRLVAQCGMRPHGLVFAASVLYLYLGLDSIVEPLHY